MTMHTQMVHKNVYSPPNEIHPEGGGHHFHFLYVPSRCLGCVPGRSYSKECKIKLMDITVGEPSKNNLVNACMYVQCNMCITGVCVLPGNKFNRLVSRNGSVASPISISEGHIDHCPLCSSRNRTELMQINLCCFIIGRMEGQTTSHLFPSWKTQSF